MNEAADSWSPDRSAAGSHNPWLIAFVVSIATFMEILDITIVNVALRHIAGGLAVSLDQSTWVLTSYLIANAVVMPISGWLSTVIGRKRFYMLCVVVFSLASLGCGLAWNFSVLLFFRVLQGISGGGMAPSEQSILADSFPPEKRGLAFSVYGAVVLMLAMWHMTHLNGDLTFWFAAMARITMAFSLPFLFIPITAASYEGLPPQKTNQASVLVNVARNLGGSIGVSMAQTLLAQRQQFHQSRLVENIIPSDPGFQMAFHRASEYFVHHGHTPAEAKRQALAWVGRTIVHQTTLWSYIDTFWVLAIVAAVMVPLAFIVRRVHGQPRSSHA